MESKNKELDLSPFLLESRVRDIQDRLEGYADEYHNGNFPEDDESHAGYLIEKYAFCTSILMGFMQDNVIGKKIVEVGPGYAGTFMLDFLVEEGSYAVGVDPYCDYIEHLGPSSGRYNSCPIEGMSSIFPKESVDLINIMSLDSDPCPEEIRRAYSFGNFFQKRKANRYYKTYNSKVSETIDFVLKREGYLLLWNRVSDFKLNPDNLNKNGYSHNILELFSKMPGRFNLDVYQKN